jgi:hypothetical protein
VLEVGIQISHISLKYSVGSWYSDITYLEIALRGSELTKYNRISFQKMPGAVNEKAVYPVQ